jgi:Protein of unknown function (DUF4235)
MSGKRANGGSRVITALVGFVAAFGARKLLHFAWKRVTGKEPPQPEDPQSALGEAVVWATVTAVGVQLARMLATRAATRRTEVTAEPRE